MKQLLQIALFTGIMLPAMASHRDHSEIYPTSYDQWQEAFLAGNGKTGMMVFGDPVHETIIFNSRMFNFPGTSTRSFAKVPRDTVEKISRLCAESRFKEANDLAVKESHWKDGGEGGRHPGFIMNIDMPISGEISGYRRSCDYSNGEISVTWSDEAGSWMRRGFVSRDSDMAVLSLTSPSVSPISCAISLIIPEEAHFPRGFRYTTLTFPDRMEIHASYPQPLDSSGYSGIVNIDRKGGTYTIKNDTLFISGANNVTLTVNIVNRIDTPHEPSIRNISYDTMLDAHTAIHSSIYNRVSLDLGADSFARSLPNEVLLSLQKSQQTPVAALWERIFDSGRYHFLSSSCEITPPDLLGIWTGDCNVGWGGFYHLDANLNLQVSAGNIADMPEAMEGYFNLIETWVPDFRRNARDLLGCRGMVACGNSPGLSSGLMASINEYYPYQYATGEMAWLLYPFWEYYLVNSDTVFLRDRLYPLLHEMGNFYSDFLRHKDANGRYILTGSVSPENQPSNLHVSLLNNSAFDLAGARWTIETLIKSYDILGIDFPQDRARWQMLFDNLPDYLINSDGAIAEWGWDGLDDNYDHRHFSHLMMVWPYREISPDGNTALYEAALRALELRDNNSQEGAGHKYLHGALISAVLHNPYSLASKMDNLIRRDFFFPVLRHPTIPIMEYSVPTCAIPSPELLSRCSSDLTRMEFISFLPYPTDFLTAPLGE